MKNFLKPKWIFIINTLPVVLLFFIFYNEYSIIHSLLKEEALELWKWFGLALLTLGILNFLYGIIITLKKQKVSVVYGFFALFSYILFIYIYGYYVGHMIPFSIPRWMRTANIEIYVGTFLMPTLMYSLFILVAHFTSEKKEHKAWVNFMIVILIPILCYLFSQVIFPLWNPRSEFATHTILVLIILATLVFLFFLIRGLYVSITKKGENWKKFQLFWKIPISLILPIVGLLINNGSLFTYGLGVEGIFGNFNNEWFYILTIINAVFICLPNSNNKLYRLLLFIGRSITLSFTGYFFMVFLPFLPLSVLAIIALGLGFLLLAPVLLFVLHINEISKDFNYLTPKYSKKVVWLVSIIGFLVIPFCIHINYLQDKNSLNETLEYVFNPNYSKEYKIDKKSLQNTLNIVKSHKKNRFFLNNNRQQPYLSSYFNWLVLDNLTLSNKKINKIENIFFNKPYYNATSRNIRGNNNVDITNISSKSKYDTINKTWKSWIDLEITNKNKNPRFSEYATTLELPEGTWISDYYLYVGDRKEMGILAEKKSAMWVYSNIRNENRDPGILYYLTGNKVAFKVFPFSAGEVRKTGIELIHREPIQFKIDNNVVSLGERKLDKETSYENENIAYISSKEKSDLKKVKRNPYFHFIVDTSNKDSIANYTKRIEKSILKHGELTKNAKISFINSYVKTSKLSDNWKEEFKKQQFEGGFYLDLGIKTILYNSYKKQDNSYPILIVVTDNLHKTNLDKDYLDWKFSFPETNLFYNLNKSGDLEAHSLISNPLKKLRNSRIDFNQTVLEYQLKDNSIQYLTNNNEPSIVLKKDIFKTNISEIKEKNWNTALTIQGKKISHILHPSSSNKEWLDMVRYSFVSKIMTPVTSYLVVENEAQKAILKKKQQQVLSGNKVFDLDEDTRRMSEPSWLVIILLLVFLFWIRKKKLNSCKVSV